MAQNQSSQQPDMSALANTVGSAAGLALEDIPVVGAVMEVAKVIQNPDLLNDPEEVVRLGMKIGMAVAMA